MKKIDVKSLDYRPISSKKEILKDINATFEKGNFYGIIGPNGSGKTTLVKNILGFVSPNKGDLIIEDINLKNYKRKDLAKKLSLVPQNTNLDNSFTARDIVMMGRAPYQKRFENDTVEDILIVNEAIDLADCKEFADKKVHNLSGGEAQRVVIARAIAQDTEWIILDEPTSSLDVKHQVDLMESLTMLNAKKKKTIIAVLHDINLASEYCSDIIVLKDGRIFKQGKTEEVLRKDILKLVYDIDFTEIINPKTSKKHFVAGYK